MQQQPKVREEGGVGEGDELSLLQSVCCLVEEEEGGGKARVERGRGKREEGGGGEIGKERVSAQIKTLYATLLCF